MKFQVSARKYRPQRFSDVVGQEHITKTLKNALKNERIAQAFLLTGPRGVGKTTTARILAKALNCTNLQDNEPCHECPSCVSIQSGSMFDIIEIDAASNRGIEDLKTIRETVKYAPSGGNKYKIYIIDEVHMLTRESFNAFLKTLEEPPSYTVFIFATTDVHKVPVTIISRCQRYDFRRISVDVIKKQLQEIAEKENISIDDKALTLIAKKSDGGLRDAESFFDQAAALCGNTITYESVVSVFNFIDEEVYFRISDAMLNKRQQEAFEVCSIVYKNGWQFQDFFDGLIEHYRNILSVLVSKSNELLECAEVFKERYMKYTNTFKEADIIRALTFLSKTAQELKYSNNQKLRTEISLSQVIALESTQTLTNLLDGISKGHFPQVSVTEGNSVNTMPYVVEKKPELELREPKPISIDAENTITKSEVSSKTEATLLKTDDEVIKKIIEELGGNEIQINR